MKNYSKVAAPLNELLRKDMTFLWTDACEQAFQSLKQALMTTPILLFPNLNKEFFLSTDASTTAVGFILSQQGDDGRMRPIEFGGRALRSNEKFWSISEIECLALVEGIRHFHSFLAHRHFHIETDHLSLKYLNEIRGSTQGRLARWSLLLQNYNFTVHYKPGKMNQAADALSRIDYPPPEEVAADDVFLRDDLYISTINSKEDEPLEVGQWVEVVLNPPGGKEAVFSVINDNPTSQSPEGVSQHDIFADIDIRQAQRNCNELKPYIEYLESSELPSDEKLARKLVMQAEQFTLIDGILHHLYQPRAKNVHLVKPLITQLVIPKSLRETVLTACHTNFDHAALDRCYVLIRTRFFWERLYSDVAEFIATCEECQCSKRSTHLIRAPLHPLPIENCFGRFQIDIAGPLPKTTRGNRYMLLVMESLTRWPECFGIPDMKGSTVATILYEQVFTRLGPPLSLLSDRGGSFTSSVVTELCKLFNVKRTLTSSYRPQTNSLIERQWSTIYQSLRIHCFDQKNWDEFIPGIMMAHRSTPSIYSSNFSPYYLLHGR